MNQNDRICCPCPSPTAADKWSDIVANCLIIAFAVFAAVALLKPEWLITLLW